MRIPSSVRARFSRQEIKQSLKTRDLRLAIQRSATLLSTVDKLILSGLEQVSVDKIIKQMLSGETTGSPDIAQWRADSIDVKPDGSLSLTGIEVDPNNPKDQESFTRAIKEIQQSSQRVSIPAAPEHDSALLSEGIDEYVKDVKRGNNWTESTEYENYKIFQLVVQVIGDIPINSLTGEHARNFKQVLLKLPPYMNTKALYKGKSIDEVLAMKPSEILSITTVNKYLNRISSLTAWLKDNKYLSDNVFEGVSIKQKKTKSDKEEREIFSDEELKRIFSHPHFTGKKKPLHAHYYFLPLISLYSGLRISEASQLQLDDLELIGGKWFFNINDDGDKQLKNTAAKRAVPVHPKLIELNLLKYIEKLWDRQEFRLFPEIKRRRKGYGVDPSKWFGRFRKSSSVMVVKPTTTFHSLRHNFIDTMQKLDIVETHTATVVGHTFAKSESYKRYGKGFASEKLVECVEKVSYDNVLHMVQPYKYL